MKKIIVLTTILFSLSILLIAQNNNSMTSKSEYIEIAKFQLKAGFSDEQFLQAEQTVRKGIIKDTKGYIGRELFKNENNEWTVILRYDTKENMDALLALLKKNLHPSFQDYASMIDFSTMRKEFLFKKI
ncbi:MAG: hypothetical protein A2086_04830 [Spirochaetes bacterium GWD1_27_9]|nr:MAG: hypothetical protein A2Z98_04245 [Spirochaetes bacterium GWB1_27_13]OHD27630.1 MAG: hypothetical protein A2Y34_00285 [Spirochaetes bacterium GWC1_27_15]OHD31940.1 MAG: hypothetical protein A2086_04830 [Spirochaetes bacterium GWD1_27_9]